MKKDFKLLAFIGSVAVIAQLSNVGLEMAADRFPNSGFAKFRTYAHKGVSA